MRMTVTMALAGALLLAGCNGGRDDEDMRDENVMNGLEDAPDDAVPVNRADAPSNDNAAENRAEEPQISEQQQIQDDADASGMTSRLPDDAKAPVPVQNGAAQDQPGAARGAGNSAAQR